MTSRAAEQRVRLVDVRRSAVVVLCVASICCGTTPTEPPAAEGGAVSGTESLVAALRGAGASVVRAGVMPQSSSPFRVGSIRLRVDGHTVHVWEYRTSAEADAQAALVSPDGFHIGASIVDWIGPPHFHRGTRIIVLYVGSEESLLSLLENVLGPQFAGS